MRKVFVNEDSLDEHGLLHGAALLAQHLDEFKVDVFALEVSHVEDGVNGNLCHWPVTSGYNLGTQSCHGNLKEQE